MLQRIPIVVLVILICVQTHKDGPTPKSKVYLAIGAFFNLPNDLPLNVWAQVIPGMPLVATHLLDDCLGWFSAVDLMHFSYFVSLIFFFLFLRSEYHRNMEECIWTTVSQIQDTFDFRKF